MRRWLAGWAPGAGCAMPPRPPHVTALIGRVTSSCGQVMFARGLQADTTRRVGLGRQVWAAAMGGGGEVGKARGGGDGGVLVMREGQLGGESADIGSDRTACRGLREVCRCEGTSWQSNRISGLGSVDDQDAGSAHDAL